MLARSAVIVVCGPGEHPDTPAAVSGPAALPYVQAPLPDRPTTRACRRGEHTGHFERAVHDREGEEEPIRAEDDLSYIGLREEMTLAGRVSGGSLQMLLQNPSDETFLERFGATLELVLGFVPGHPPLASTCLTLPNPYGERTGSPYT